MDDSQRANAAPSISVALATHNGARYLGEQLRSILDQTLVPDQIVLSDDASSDDTVALARRLVEAHGAAVRLDVLLNPVPLGVTGNFARAIAATTGELVALSDQDDLWMPHRLQTMAAEFAAHPGLTLLHGDARLVDAAGEPLGQTLLGAIEITSAELAAYREGRVFDALLRRNLVTGATTMFRRGLIERAFPLPPEWVHDEWLGIVAAATGEVRVLLEPLGDYRQHGANQIGAARLSLVGKARRMLEPRRTRNERLARNSGILLERIEMIAPRHLPAVREKYEHERVRNAFPESRWARIGPVLKEARTGRYALSARGRADIMRDLLQRVD